jgi:hypothetical protein
MHVGIEVKSLSLSSSASPLKSRSHDREGSLSKAALQGTTTGRRNERYGSRDSEEEEAQEVKEEGDADDDSSSEYSNDFEDTPTKAEKYSDKIGKHDINDKNNRSGNKEIYDGNSDRPTDNRDASDGYAREGGTRYDELREKGNKARGYHDTYNHEEKVRIQKHNFFFRLSLL